MSYLSALNVEIVCFSATLLHTYESTWRHSPQQHRHRNDNLKSQI